MKKEKFFEGLLECMEIDPVKINEDTAFSELEDFDSMAVISIVAYVDEKFAASLSAEQLKNMKTVGDLMALVGREHFEE